MCIEHRHRVTRAPYSAGSLLVSRSGRDYPEVSHTCWNNAVISDTGNSCETLTRSPSHSTLSVSVLIRLYRKMDVDNINMGIERWKYNLWNRERWVLRTCPGTTLSTTNSTLSALGLSPDHNRKRPATKHLSNGTGNLKTSAIKFRTDLAFVCYTACFLDSDTRILRRMYLSENWIYFVSHGSALS